MHELSVAANILETVQQHVPLARAGAARAVRVRVVSVKKETHAKKAHKKL